MYIFMVLFHYTLPARLYTPFLGFHQVNLVPTYLVLYIFVSTFAVVPSEPKPKGHVKTLQTTDWSERILTP